MYPAFLSYLSTSLVRSFLLLTSSQAENEQETNAIAALRCGAKLPDARPSIHLALAVSYTNEVCCIL